jgi:helicase-like protein
MPLGGSAMLPIMSSETGSNAAHAKSQAEAPMSAAIDAIGRFSESTLPSTSACLPNRAAAALSADNFTATSKGVGLPSIIATQREPLEDCFVPGATTASVIIKTIQNVSDVPLIISMQPDDAAWVVWCNLNKEQDALASSLGDRCFSVYGTLPADQKVERIFGWIRGERPVLLSKPSICGHGLNLQRCRNMIFVGLTDSFEQIYQAIRRCWRFGQTRPVDVYFVASELEGAVVANLKRKELAFDAMLDAMAGHMRDLMQEQVIRGRVASDGYAPKTLMELPVWLT